MSDREPPPSQFTSANNLVGFNSSRLSRRAIIENDITKRFDEVASQIDGLYQRDEKREQEYLFIREQIRRLESSSLS